MYIKDKFSCNNNYVNAISAGINCLGFVMRSAEYADIPNNERPVSPYYNSSCTWPWDGKLDDHLPNSNWQDVGEDKKRVWVKTDIGNCVNIVSNTDSTKLAAVYPGSIVYIQFSSNADTSTKHTAIVRNVNFIGPTRTLTLSDLNRISLIEATWDNDNLWAKVVKSDNNGLRTLSLYSNTYKWEINKMNQ